MRLGATAALISFAAAGSIGGCRDGLDWVPQVTGAGRNAVSVLRETTSIDGRTHESAGAAEHALAKATVIDLPYAEWGSFLASDPARAVAFVGAAGQVVKVTLARPEPRPSSLFVDGNVRAELFLVQARAGALTHVRLAEIPAGESGLWFRLPAGASYVVRLQPEQVTDALYRFSVELEAALPFPVKGRSDDAVGSLFGMLRDAGARHHEGIDIFAPRLTPVVAVADGRATPRENSLGGHTVWLSTPGTSYYYAHLERTAVTSGQRVRAGDVIGYVGNSGNAASTDPHLHFGIYRWGQGAIDPFPLLQARRFVAPLGKLPREHLVQASLQGGCASAPRVRRVAVAAHGCAMRMGSAIEGANLAEAADCLTRELQHPESAGHREQSSDFEWQAAAPLSIEDGAALIVPVDFDPVGAVFELPALADDGDSIPSACELASASGVSSHHAGPPQPYRVMAF